MLTVTLGNLKKMKVVDLKNAKAFNVVADGEYIFTVFPASRNPYMKDQIEGLAVIHNAAFGKSIKGG